MAERVVPNWESAGHRSASWLVSDPETFFFWSKHVHPMIYAASLESFIHPHAWHAVADGRDARNLFEETCKEAARSRKKFDGRNMEQLWRFARFSPQNSSGHRLRDAHQHLRL